jgi:uncharacterized membrane protein YfcA
MIAEIYWLLPAFFLVAFTYAMAGFGGGSSYLALLALTALPTVEMRATALLCNLVVAGGGVWHFSRAGKMPWKPALPLVLLSVPAAYLGGSITLPRDQFLLLLALVLLFAAGAMWWQTTGQRKPSNAAPIRSEAGELASAGFLGGGLGFLAGLVGIGGGIFLSPVLFLRQWAPARSIAAVTSLFIFVNSLAGLAGQYSVLGAGPDSYRGQVQWFLVGCLMVAVFMGGQMGTRLSVNRLKPTNIRRIAAALIFLVALRLLARHFGVW